MFLAAQSCHGGHSQSSKARVGWWYCGCRLETPRRQPRIFWADIVTKELLKQLLFKPRVCMDTGPGFKRRGGGGAYYTGVVCMYVCVCVCVCVCLCWWGTPPASLAVRLDFRQEQYHIHQIIRDRVRYLHSWIHLMWCTVVLTNMLVGYLLLAVYITMNVNWQGAPPNAFFFFIFKHLLLCCTSEILLSYTCPT